MKTLFFIFVAIPLALLCSMLGRLGVRRWGQLKRFLPLLLLVAGFAVKAKANPPGSSRPVTNYVYFFQTNYTYFNQTNWIFNTTVTTQTNFVFQTNYVIYTNAVPGVTNYVEVTNTVLTTNYVVALWNPPNGAAITNLNVYGNLITNPNSTNAGQVVTLSMGTNVTGHLP